MTDKLRELVERLENSSPYGFNLHHEAAAALRELIEQKPVAVNDGNGFITPHGDPVPIGPLYAMPVAQPSKEWLDEAMRLADEYRTAGDIKGGPRTVYERIYAARAALREHLEKR
jgi:hypothetical protein